MHPELLDHLLLLTAVLCAVTLVRLLRRSDGRGYAFVVGTALVMAVLALGQSRFLGAVAIALATLTVIVPWLFEHLSRWAFARGHLSWMARLSTWRAMLMPGSGLSRQIPILDGLALLERRGVDAALAHFRRLADEAEEPVELALIHEQIVAMLFYDQRWDEGIAHYERRFHPGYAALRPSLALGLLRAYGESGRLETAAGLLRALEEGPIGADPGTAELLGQARLTFLAYAGAVAPVDELVERRRFAQLGLTPATAELFLGIAQARAGQSRQAVETLRKVEQLAGARDHRVLEASRDTLREVRNVLREGMLAATFGAPDSAARGPELDAPDHPSVGRPVELGPELRGYVDLVGERLREFIAAPSVRRNERTWVTHGVIALTSMIYGVHLLRGGGSIGLLELGALSEDLWRQGEWTRVFTATWIHVDLVGLLFDAYAIWLAGQVVERVLGGARMGLATLGAASAGMAASVLALPLLWELGLGSLALVAATGGSLLAVGAVTAALWLLLPSRTPMLGPRARRSLIITLSLLLIANTLITLPATAGFGVAPVGLLVTVVVASVVGLLPRPSESALGRLGDRLAWLSFGALLVVGLGSAVTLLGSDPERELVEHRAQTCTVEGVELRTPIGYTQMRLDREVPFELPIVDGLLDPLELRDGSLAQLAVVRGAASEPSADPEALDQLALFREIEGLDSELGVTMAGPLPEPFAARLADDGQRWRARDLWRNGELVARVVERDLPVEPGQEPATVVLLVTPASALGHAAELWAGILADARVVGDAQERGRCWVD